MARDVDKIWEKHEIDFKYVPVTKCLVTRPHLGLREDIL